MDNEPEGIDDLSPRLYVSTRFEEVQPNIEGIDFLTLFGPFIAVANAEYQRTPIKLREEFNRQMQRIVTAKNIGEMARYLGAEMVAYIRKYSVPGSVADRPCTIDEARVHLDGGFRR